MNVLQLIMSLVSVYDTCNQRISKLLGYDPFMAVCPTVKRLRHFYQTHRDY